MTFSRFGLLLWALLGIFPLRAEEAPLHSWFAELEGKRFALDPDQDGNYRVRYDSPSALIYRTSDRTRFHHDRTPFDSKFLEFDLTLSGDLKQPVKAWIFLKDKDGDWFQSEQEFKLENGKKTTLRVRLDEPGRHLLPQGHGAAWSAHYASGMFEVGVSLWNSEPCEIQAELSPIRFSGERDRPALAIRSWTVPDAIRKHEMFESRFELSREYFNPYDPDEIAVDYEIELPGNTLDIRETAAAFLQKPDMQRATFPFPETFRVPMPFSRTDRRARLALPAEEPRVHLRYPAFFAQDFVRGHHLTRELLRPAGAPYWAFRMTPFASGTMRVRLRVQDRSGGKLEQIVTPWREIQVADSDLPGPVVRSATNPQYFDFTNGSFFFPVSLNVHTNVDQRSEFKFGWGALPDRGTWDYDDYLEACAEKGGISLIELWMASWTFAIEWDSARQYYYGVGRYNMANAWRLDHVIDTARKRGIRINLVLDSHGKLSYHNDQEWDHNPLNTKGAFAVANQAILDNPGNYWVDFNAIRSNSNRNRYIAARWGADPNIFAFEFWSEVDLCENAWGRYHKGWLPFWHSLAGEELKRMSQAVRLFSTHTCGDAGNSVNYKEACLFLPEFTHVCSDAYRGPERAILDQLRRHRDLLQVSGRPLLITEYGGTAFAANEEFLRADIHAGQWGSLFLRQAGSPALWWHDFVHIRGVYNHYAALRKYIDGLDLTKGELVFSEHLSPTRYSFSPYRALSRKNLRSGVELLFEELSARIHPLRDGFALHDGFPPFTDFLDLLSIRQDRRNLYGWLFLRGPMKCFPTPENDLIPTVSGFVVDIPNELESGIYALSFHDTKNGEVLRHTLLPVDGPRIQFKVPDFHLDVAFKIERLFPSAVMSESGASSP